MKKTAKTKQPKILFFDLETSPNVGYTWQKWEQNVIAFQKEWEILSFAYKYSGQKEVYCFTKEGEKTDKKLVERLHKLFEDADVLVAHNGDSFDIKKTNARMLYHGMKPPKITSSIDTKKAAKSRFNFNSNSLDDLGNYLGLGRKVKHQGFDLWLGCMADDAASWKEMAKYNKQDVVLLEKVYEKFKPWMLTHPNMAKLINPTDNALGVCQTCTSTDVQKRGFRATRTSVKQQWVCNACDSWFLTKVSN